MLWMILSQESRHDKQRQSIILNRWLGSIPPSVVSTQNSFFKIFRSKCQGQEHTLTFSPRSSLGSSRFVHRFIVMRRYVANRRMDSLAIVKDFDVLENRLMGGFSGLKLV